MDAQFAIQKILNEQFVEARLRNPSYSVRAFARKLGMSSAAVSEILNGKRRISRKLALRIADRLALDPEQTRALVASFEGARTEINTRPLQNLDMEHFRVVADWYHFAILSLAETEGFRGEAKWIAQRLDLPVREVEAAIKRLEKLEMLLRDGRGRLRATGVQYATPDEIANVALRRLHAQNLELARVSLERDPIDQRDFSAVTMAIDPAKLPEAKKLIRKFHKQLNLLLGSGRKKDVYKMCLQLIPLTHTVIEKGDKK